MSTHSIPMAEHLEGGAIVFLLRFRRAWVDHVEEAVPSDLREWDLGAKCWTVWPPYAGDVLRFTRQAFGCLSETGARTAALCDPFRTLHLLPTAPREVVEAAFRALAKIHHPDRGCDDASMRQLNAAYAALRVPVA